ncbi:P-loop containing nucleoside triphosphate hydrolase protein, partial [Podospora conica]
TTSAIRVAEEMLSIARHRPCFGNGGDVENLVHAAQAARNARCARVAADAELDMRLMPEDFDADWQRTLDATRRCADAFVGMQGMGDIIAQFQRYQVMATRLRARGHDPRAHIPWALVFRGPPGTGKTTVARKMAQIYYDMGFLSAPEVVECSVADLLSSYTAGSGKRVIRAFERALGKVLFIDEAYRLAESRSVDAIGEIVDCMTKERFLGNLVVVLAGYKDEMDALMRCNRGLRSRFATDVDFVPMDAD